MDPASHPAPRVAAIVAEKFASKAWLDSPYRNFEYARSKYMVRRVVEEDERGWKTPKYYIPPTAADIRQMIARRDARVDSGDPYADWDYVACTLSKGELLRIADWLDRHGNGAPMK